MKTLIAMLMLSAAAIGQEFRITERSTFTITERASQTDKEFYVVMFAASWCGPCQPYKTTGQLERLKARFPVRVVDVDQDKRWNVHSVPTFWLCDRATQTKVKAWTGRTDVETIEREVIRIRDITKARVVSEKTLAGDGW